MIMSRHKVLILTISHIWFDTRIYFKIIKSLIKKDTEILLITGNEKENEDIDKEENLTIIKHPNAGKHTLLKHFIIEGLNFKPTSIICIEPLTLLAGLVLKKKSNCRVIYDAHEYYLDAYKEKKSLLYYPYRFYETNLAKQTDAIITVNEGLVNIYKHDQLPMY